MTKIFLKFAWDVVSGWLIAQVFLHAHWSVGLLALCSYVRFILSDLIRDLEKLEGPES